MKAAQNTYKKIAVFIDTCKSQSYHLNKKRVFLLIRYLFAGSLSFVSNIGLLFILVTYLSWWYLAASVVAFVISVIISFLAQKYITFRDKSTDRIPNQMFQYILIALFNVIANTVMVFILVDFMHILYLIAQILSAGAIAVWSLFVYRFIIFRYNKHIWLG